MRYAFRENREARFAFRESKYARFAFFDIRNTIFMFPDSRLSSRATSLSFCKRLSKAAEFQSVSFLRVRHVSLVITLIRQHYCLTNGTCSAKDLVVDDVLYSQHPSASLCLDNVERSSTLTN